MALKMLYRGPSSRLETLIEKIQQNKDSPGMIQNHQIQLLSSETLSKNYHFSVELLENRIPKLMDFIATINFAKYE